MFRIDPNKIILGQSAQLSWEVVNAKNIRIEPELSQVEPKGTIEISPISSTAYTIRAINQYGIQQKTIWIIVEQPIQKTESNEKLPVINSFIATPDKIWPGAVTRLSWDVSNATILTIKDERGNIINENCLNKGDIILRPVINTSFVLIAENSAGVVTETVKIEVNSSIPNSEPGGSGNVGNFSSGGGSGGCG